MNIRELATMCGVSRTTASLALRDDARISLYVRRKLQQTARALGYQPDPRVAQVLTSVARRNRQDATTPLALISPWPHRREWEHNWILKQFHDGMKRRAAEFGYRLEEFWLGEPGMSESRMHDILKARGIEGVVIFNYVNAPAKMEFDANPFACVVLGRALLSPQVAAVDHDHYQGISLALAKLAELGYVRPGLLIIDDQQARERTSHQWEAAYLMHQQARPKSKRVPLLLASAQNVRTIAAWFRREKPDAIIGVHPATNDVLASVGIRTPADAGFATLVWRSSVPACAGVDIQCEQIGCLALDLLIEQLRHQRRSLPAAGYTLLVNGVWREGVSLRMDKEASSA